MLANPKEGLKNNEGLKLLKSNGSQHTNRTMHFWVQCAMWKEVHCRDFCTP